MHDEGTGTYLAVDDIEMLIGDVFEHFVDVVFPIKLTQSFQQVTPAVNPYIAHITAPRAAFQPQAPCKTIRVRLDMS